MPGLLVVFAFLFGLATPGAANLADLGALVAPAPEAPRAVQAAPATTTAPADNRSSAGFTTNARVHRPVATASSGAQAAFDDGLLLLYAYNPEEARRSFESATRSDPSLAIAWWGIAMSYGVNINTGFDPAAQNRGQAAIRKAQMLAAASLSTTSVAERSLIEAAARRFAYRGAGDADRSARAYRDAMNVAAAANPGDDDVLTLAAEAEMDVHAWDYFTPDGVATPGTNAIVARLETVLARTPNHIGANHFLIHACEESQTPQRALAAARRLAALDFEPSAEHLTHMPAHVFMRIGEYEAAGDANAKALDLYRTYLASNPAGHTDYIAHDCRFGVDAFMMAGDYGRARGIAVSCASSSHGLVAEVDLRFRRYDTLASDADPGGLAIGILDARAGKFEAAKLELATLDKRTDDAGKISSRLLEAAIAGARSDSTAQISALKRAVDLEDREGYSEPPAFWYPVRESLGAALERAGRLPDAERTFRDDLARNPENPHSLFGLAQTLADEHRSDDSRAVRDRFARAWKARLPLGMKDL